METLISRTLEHLKKEYVVAGKTRVRSWNAWLVIGLALGIAVGIILVANRSGQFEASQAAIVTQMPLLQKSNLVYQGAFLAPDLGDPGFHYGGSVMTYNPANNSLFIVGHDQYQLAAEISIPTPVNSGDTNNLNTATLLQDFQDVTEGGMYNIPPGSTFKVGGMMVSGGKLYSTAYAYYDVTGGAQFVSHFVKSKLNLSATGDISGPFQVGSLGAGFVDGWMIPIPSEWQSQLGAPFITGNCCLSGLARTSSGPAAFGFDTANLGVLDPVPDIPYVYYDINNQTLGGWSETSPYYNGTTQIHGAVFPGGTGSILFIGRHGGKGGWNGPGSGNFCYGPGTADPNLVGKFAPDDPLDPYCYDPDDSAKGDHGYPYYNQVWAYNANDFIAVKNGTKNPWDIVPYAAWDFTLPTGGSRIGGVAYDPSTQRIFVAEIYGNGDMPVIHVFQVQTAQTPDVTPPTVPTGLNAVATSSSQINLSWTASTDPIVSGQITSGLAGYKIYRNGTQIATSTTGTSYSDTGLSANISYSYTVAAFDAAGNNSAQSASASATTLVGQTTSSNIYDSMPDNSWTLTYHTYADEIGISAPPVGIEAFSGMGFDGGKLYLFGGGHHDYWGNEIWIFDPACQNCTISDPANPHIGSWSRQLVPDDLSGLTQSVCKSNTNDLNYPGLWLPSGRPVSRHTQDSVTYLPNSNVLMASGGSLWSGANDDLWLESYPATGCYSLAPSDVWTYNFASSAWTYLGSHRVNAGVHPYSNSVYNSDDGLLYTDGGYKYNANNNLWTAAEPSPAPLTNMIYDAVHHRIYYGTDSALYSYNPSDNTTVQMANSSHSMSGVYGITYDSLTNEILAFGGSGLFAYNVANGGWTARASGPPTGVNLSINLYSRIQYMPKLNVTLVVTQSSVDERVDVWVYKNKNVVPISPPADIIPPSIPTGLLATSISSSQINLSWTASTDNVGVAGYKIFRNGIQIATPTTNSYSDINLSPSTTYSYTVSAYDAAGNNSAQSASASATTQAASGSVNIPLTVKEALPAGVDGIARVSEPVTVGIPLPENSGLTSINQLGLSAVSAGQFRELAHWPNGNIKWVLADFQTNVLAGGTNAGVSLTTGSGNFGGANLATDNGPTISVDTGAAQFRIKKSNFNIFDSAVVNGKTLVSPGNSGGLVGRDQNNNIFSSANDNASTAIIEENGPVRTVIKGGGALKNSAGQALMDYTLRIHFYKGKSYVKSFVTVSSAVSPFHSVEAIVPTNLGSSKTVEFATKSGTVSASLQPTDVAYLYQGFSTDKFNPIDNDCYTWTPPVPGTCNGNYNYTYDQNAAGLGIQAGTNMLSSLGIQDNYTQGFSEIRDSSNSGVTLAYRWMSSYWPAGFEFKGDGTTSIELFSKHNTKTDLTLLPKHEVREILWDFHTASANNQTALYNLQYPLIASASFSQYQNTKAIFGQGEFVTAQQENQFFSDLGRSALSPSLDNPGLIIYRMWPWGLGGGDNQTDFPLNDLQDFLRTGNPGFYLAGEQRTIFNASTYFDAEHAHMLSMPFYYFLSGDESIKEGVLSYGGELLNNQTTGNYSLPDDPYFRAWSRSYRNNALIYEFTCYVSACANSYQSIVGNATDFLLDSRDNPSDPTQRGRNLDRGYLYWDSTLFDSFGYRVVHSFFHTQIHFEAVWQALRVMNNTGWNYPRKQEMEDYLLGLSQFFLNEYYDEKNGGTAVTDFGVEYDYPVDQKYTTPSELIPYDVSRAAVFGYQKTGDQSFLSKANKLVWAITSYATDRSPSELQDQSLMYAYFNPPQTWKSLPVSVHSNGNGSYTLTWTVPQGVGQYQIKYSNKPIVEWLGFNKVTGAYRYNPSRYTAFFAASNISNNPVPLTTGTQSLTLSGLSCGSTCYFSMKSYGGVATTLSSPYDTVPPSVPTGLTATAVSSSQINLSWTASTDPIVSGQITSGLAGYKIYRNGTQIATSTTGTSYSDTGLSANTSYSYTVAAFDAAGNNSAQSTSVNASLLPVNLVAPIIFNISASSLTTNSATITWTTDELSDSQVEYGLTTSYGSASTLNPTLSTSHSVTISNLSSGSVYNFRVKSKDAAGNLAASLNSNFTTSAAPISDTQAPNAINNLSASNLQSNSASLSWTAPTDPPNNSAAASYDIRYATSTITSSNFSQAIKATGEPIPSSSGTNQTYILAGLTPATYYYAAIISKDTAGNISNLSNIIYFSTASTSSASPLPSYVPPTTSGGGSYSAGGNGGVALSITNSLTPSSFKALGASDQIVLRWTNPQDYNFVRTLVVRKEGSASTSTTDGTILYEGDKQEFTDITAKPGIKYYYSIFGLDRNLTPSTSTVISASLGDKTNDEVAKTISQPATKTQALVVSNTSQQPLPKFVFTRFLQKGSNNQEVKNLQTLLNTLGFTVSRSGAGSKGNETTLFGGLTKEALSKFQAKYLEEVLAGDRGIVGPKTRAKLNELSGWKQTETGGNFLKLVGPFSFGLQSDQVKTLQEYLSKDTSIYPEQKITGYYGTLTKEAVKRFQQKYGIEPTGLAGPATRKKLNELYGK